MSIERLSRRMNTIRYDMTRYDRFAIRYDLIGIINRLNVNRERADAKTFGVAGRTILFWKKRICLLVRVDRSFVGVGKMNDER
jgi:hypothetical protein